MRLPRDLREYDLVSVPDPQTFEEYQALGTFRLSLLEPAIHPPALMEFVPSERRGVVVVADADPNNIDAVLTLEPVDDLMIFGDGWADIPVNAACIDDLPLLERASLFAGSKLVLELPVSKLFPTVFDSSVPLRTPSHIVCFRSVGGRNSLAGSIKAKCGADVQSWGRDFHV